MAVESTVETKDFNIEADYDEEENGIEIELEDPQEKITVPFDPERIKIRTVNVVVDQIISRVQHGEIDLAPDFQRQAGIWNNVRKSRLIESLLLRIPIPVFYVAADRSDTWSVVDGVQRISSIYDFVNGQFPLNRLEYLTRLEGNRYDLLPRPLQRRINETQLVVNIIDPGTPPEVMFNVFLRINTGGLTLNGQEIRHAMHPGIIRDYLKELAHSDEFAKATDYSVKKDRMADRECVLRFLAFHIVPWETYSATDLNGHLGDSMQMIDEMSSEGREVVAQEFRKAMRAAVAIFGKDAFRKRTTESDRRRPVSKALFEAWSVQLARCSQEQISILIEQRDHVQRRFMELISEDSEFERAISYSTGSPQRVRKRFQAIEQLVKEFC